MDREESKLIPNSTQIPNILIDFLIPQLPKAEERCMLYISRRTYGFHKEEDRISFSQFVKGIKNRDGKQLDHGAGIARPSVSEALKNLRKAKAIFVRKDSKGNYYKINLNMNVNKVVKEVNQLRKLTNIGKRSEPILVKLLNPQKKGNKEKQSNMANFNKFAVDVKKKSDNALLVNYYFELKNWDNQPKEFYIKNNISYPRNLKVAKELLTLTDGKLEEAKQLIEKTADWAEDNGLEWAMETCIKRYLKDI